MQIRTLLLLCQTGFIIAAILFTVASFREREPRAPWMGFLGALIFLILGIMLFKFDDTAWLSFIPGVFVCFLLFFLLPGSPDAKSIHGSMGYIAGEIKKMMSGISCSPATAPCHPAPMCIADITAITRRRKKEMQSAEQEADPWGRSAPSIENTGRTRP